MTISSSSLSITTFYSHLLCSKTGKKYNKQELHSYSEANKPLVAQYDFRQPMAKSILKDRPLNMWRYREMLPIEFDDNIVSLGEGMTPLLAMENIGSKIGLPRLWLKDEAINPTGSFKARGLAMAISKAKELGVKKCVIPTAGNAGGAMSAYCAKAGLEAHVYMPKLTPQCFQLECQFYGAKLRLVDGNISDCGRQIKAEKEADWFDVSTLKEPFRLEGKKTMGYEIVEQMDWQVPDVIVYPTGGGTGLLGIWKAFGELEALGWIGSKRPRMVAVQTQACYPIVEAFEKGQSSATPFANPAPTMANGLRVPAAFGDEMILDILYQSKGKAVAISEDEMYRSIQEFAQAEGRLLSPEGAAVWAATKALREQAWIKEEESVVMLNTGSIYKYMENL